LKTFCGALKNKKEQHVIFMPKNISSAQLLEKKIFVVVSWWPAVCSNLPRQLTMQQNVPGDHEAVFGRAWAPS
jgi:hypothetical protein